MKNTQQAPEVVSQADPNHFATTGDVMRIYRGMEILYKEMKKQVFYTRAIFWILIAPFVLTVFTCAFLVIFGPVVNSVFENMAQSLR